jgi:transcriptional regulator with XRE-family HTH domain
VRRYPTGHMAIMSAMASARKLAGLSQRQLSVKLKEPINYIHRIENGERDVGVSEFVVIARAIGVDPAELLKRGLR